MVLIQLLLQAQVGIANKEKQFDPFPLASLSRTALALIVAMWFTESRESFVALIGYREEKV